MARAAGPSAPARMGVRSGGRGDHFRSPPALRTTLRAASAVGRGPGMDSAPNWNSGRTRRMPRRRVAREDRTWTTTNGITDLQRASSPARWSAPGWRCCSRPRRDRAARRVERLPGVVRDAVADRYRALAEMAGVELENFEERVDRAAAANRVQRPRSARRRAAAAAAAALSGATLCAGRCRRRLHIGTVEHLAAPAVGDRAWKGHAMIPRFVLTTVGAAVASLAAASAQPPPTTQPTAPQPGAMVTVEGCLTQEWGRTRRRRPSPTC